MLGYLSVLYEIQALHFAASSHVSFVNLYIFLLQYVFINQHIYAGLTMTLKGTELISHQNRKVVAKGEVLFRCEVLSSNT